MRFFPLIIISVIILSACGDSNPDPNKEASLEDVARAKSINNSELISNPVTANSPLDPDKTAKITFEKEVFDFGVIKQGDVVEDVFKFKNTGNAPLIISSATGSCGCTVPEPPKDPIAPGQSSEIKVKFNSTGKEGIQNKTVTIIANTLPNTESKLTVKGTVLVEKK